MKIDIWKYISPGYECTYHTVFPEWIRRNRGGEIVLAGKYELPSGMFIEQGRMTLNGDLYYIDDRCSAPTITNGKIRIKLIKQEA